MNPDQLGYYTEQYKKTCKPFDNDQTHSFVKNHCTELGSIDSKKKYNRLIEIRDRYQACADERDFVAEHFFRNDLIPSSPETNQKYEQRIANMNAAAESCTTLITRNTNPEYDQIAADRENYTSNLRFIIDQCREPECTPEIKSLAIQLQSLHIADQTSFDDAHAGFLRLQHVTELIRTRKSIEESIAQANHRTKKIMDKPKLSLPIIPRLEPYMLNTKKVLERLNTFSTQLSAEQIISLTDPFLILLILFLTRIDESIRPIQVLLYELVSQLPNVDRMDNDDIVLDLMEQLNTNLSGNPDQPFSRRSYQPLSIRLLDTIINHYKQSLGAEKKSKSKVKKSEDKILAQAIQQANAEKIEYDIQRAKIASAKREQEQLLSEQRRKKEQEQLSIQEQQAQISQKKYEEELVIYYRDLLIELKKLVQNLIDYEMFENDLIFTTRDAYELCTGLVEGKVPLDDFIRLFRDGGYMDRLKRYYTYGTEQHAIEQLAADMNEYYKHKYNEAPFGKKRRRRHTVKKRKAKAKAFSKSNKLEYPKTCYNRTMNE